MKSNNSLISAFLDCYFGLENPPLYAVMIKGGWGSGKTWFINKEMEKHKELGREFLRVSLYGLTSAKEIEYEFFRQLHPILASKKMALVSKVAKGFLRGTIRFDLDGDGTDDGSAKVGVPDLNLQENLNSAGGRILVFDDLERCSIPIADLLGFINFYVENCGHKVVIVANEDEILRGFKGTSDNAEKQNSVAGEGGADKYLRTKEKLVGKTFEVQTVVNDALLVFINELNPKSRDLLLRHSDVVIDVFEKSKYLNLRYLRQSLFDFSLLIDVLQPRAQEKEDLIEELLCTHFALSFELKSGRLVVDDINKSIRSGMEFAYGETGRQLLADMESKYAPRQPTRSSISGRSWKDILGRGFLDAEKINEQVNYSQHFIEEWTPEWVKLWHGRLLEDDEFDSIICNVERKFSSGGYAEIGVIRHVVGMLLHYAEHDFGALSKSEIVNFAKSNINSLLQKDLRRVCYESGFDRFSLREIGYSGLDFMSKDSNEFREVDRYLDDAIKRAREQARPQEASDLLGSLEGDATEFCAKFMWENRTASKFWDVPILAEMDPEVFFDRFVKLAPRAKFRVVDMLQNRYEGERADIYLFRELPWLEYLADRIHKESQSNVGKISNLTLNQIATALRHSHKAMTSRIEQRAQRNGIRG